MDVRLKTPEKPARTTAPRALLPRSLAFRLALLYGIAFAVSAAALVGALYLSTITALTQQRDRAITAELAELKSELNEGGLEEVRKEIATRDNAPEKSQFVYAFYDKNNRLLAGSPIPIARRTGWTDVFTAVDDPGHEAHTIHFLAAILPGGMFLEVGVSTHQLDDLRTLLAAALLAGLAIALVLALAGGAVLSWNFGRRLDRVSVVCREIMNGKLSLRIPAQGTGDEIDLLASSVNSMLDRIVGLMDTLRQISTDVAHDLRTPLARLRQGLEATKFKARTTNEYAAAVDKAIGEADTILDTFAALLRIAELEAGTRRAAFVTVDLSQLCRTVADAYTPPAEENGQHIAARIDPAVSVTGDANLLTQMIANLVANALRHGPRGTKVGVTLSGGAHPTVVIADDGPGIPEEDRTRVFQRFVRLESSRTTPGSGLGLALCAAIAELHGVRIELKDNHPGLRCELTF